MGTWKARTDASGWIGPNYVVSFTDRVSCGCYFDRALTADEVRLLYENYRL